MTILLVNQFFAPDPAPTGRLLADLARQLAADGHKVVVVCARAEYAGDGNGGPEPEPSLTVRRVPGPPFSHGSVARVLSYGWFCLGALFHCLRAEKPALVITLTTPPLLSLLGTLLKKLRGCRHFIWEMDVYPDVAVALGLLRPRSGLTRAIDALADYSRRQADGIIALGPCMRDRLLAHGLPASSIHVAENWADGSLIRPVPVPAAPPLTVLYSGNLGLAHDTGTVLAAMERLADDPRFRFVFAGAGPRRRDLEERCRAARLANVSFTGYRDPAVLSEHFGACHVGLVTQNPATLGAVVPSKAYALMAAARPVLFIGPRDATPARVIERFRCGWQVDPGDTAALLSLLHLLAADPELVSQAGRRGRQAFLEHYDLPAGVARLCGIVRVPAPQPSESLP